MQVTEPLQRTLAALAAVEGSDSQEVASPDELLDGAPEPSIPARTPYMCALLCAVHWPGPLQQHMSSPQQ